MVVCPPDVCGMNSPEIDHNGFHELHKRGAANDQGFAIVGFVQGDTAYTLEVTGARLLGLHPSLPPLQGKDLVGAELRLVGPGGAYVLRVAAVHDMRFPVGAPDLIETYVLEYGAVIRFERPPATWTNVCGGLWFGEDDAPYAELGGDLLGQRPGDTILFDLDRVDADRKTLNREPDHEWFNLGCAGHTLSKLFLTRNMIASQGRDHLRLSRQRQAALKLLTADYTGDGTAFTVAGQPLIWQGGAMSYPVGVPPRVLEARWDAGGAICLDTPRMTTPGSELGAKRFPDIEAAIADHCAATGCVRPPRCKDSDPMVLDGSILTSANRH